MNKANVVKFIFITTIHSSSELNKELSSWRWCVWQLTLRNLMTIIHLTFKTQTKEAAVLFFLKHDKNLQLDSFVPVDYVTRASERLDIDHMDIASFCTNIEPLALEGQVTLWYPAESEIYCGFVILISEKLIFHNHALLYVNDVWIFTDLQNQEFILVNDKRWLLQVLLPKWKVKYETIVSLGKQTLDKVKNGSQEQNEGKQPNKKPICCRL